MRKQHGQHADERRRVWRDFYQHRGWNRTEVRRHQPDLHHRRRSGYLLCFGGVLAGKISETTSTSVTAITSGGSQANIDNLDMGDAQIGFVQTDVGAYAYEGSRLFADIGKVDNFSTVANLYMEQVQIVTLDPNIKSVADLAGKNVSVGAAGSGVYYNAVDVLGATAWT